MKRALLLSVAAFGGLAMALPAAAQPRPNYGGGFLEMLVTGREPTQAPLRSEQAVMSRLVQQGGPMRGAPAGMAPLYADPFEQAAASARGAPYEVAALPGYVPEEGRIGRAIEPRFQRQEVAYHGPHAAGTIVIDTPAKFLYLVQANGRALRYGIGVGRPGFEWAGVKTVTRKAVWPDWTPPAQMRRRRPDLPHFMQGGPENPMGARALYLGSSLYRIHGTNEPWTIGQAVSSGCIRMMNEDVTDLYERARVGTKVIVI